MREEGGRWLPRGEDFPAALGIIVLITLAPETTAIADLLVIPATIGEFAILLSLLIRGVPARALRAVDERRPATES